MREIKFRGISQYTGKMVYGQLLRGENDFNIVTHFGHVIDIELVPIKKGTQGQYTGLKDENGCEIYEGDVIYWEIDNGIGIESYTGIICWSENLEKEGWNETYQWLVRYTNDHLRGRFDSLSFPASYKGGLRIIGNIYENPELLERA